MKQAEINQSQIQDMLHRGAAKRFDGKNELRLHQSLRSSAAGLCFTL